MSDVHTLSSEGSSSSDLSRTRSNEYEYLDYDIELPHPLRLPTGDLPEPPDLSKYNNPREWSWAHKMSVIWQSVIGAILTSYAAGMYAPPAQAMADEWHISRVAAMVGVSIFTVGFGVGPMVLAPFSEINGRRPVFVIAGLIFVITSIGCAVTQSYSGMLVVRLIAGLTSSVFSTMVGGVVADIYEVKDRNTGMSLFAGGVLFGTGLGPLVAESIVYFESWRWVFGSHAFALALLMVFLVFLFDETRGNVLLSKKAKKLNAWYEACEKAGSPGVVYESEKSSPQRVRWRVKADEERASIAVMINISCTRPFILLFTEPTVFFFSLWISFSWAILFLQFSIIPYLYETTYNFTPLQSNAIFTSVCVATPLATILSIYTDKLLYRRLPPHLSSQPENRLYPSTILSILLPISLFWLGWTARPSIHWMVPTLAIAFANIGIMSIYLATFNYLADAYGPFASSAIAGQSLCRNLLAGAFPVFAEAFFKNVGIGPASSILGGAGIALTAVPYVLVAFGPRIRARSPFATQIRG